MADPRTPAQVRPARASDHHSVATVLIESRRAFMPYAPSAHTEREVRQWVQDVLLPAGGVSVATLDAAVCGVLATADDGAYRWIRQLFVAPAEVGRGLGTRLLHDALARLAPPVRLYTFQANVGARRFYERNGFETVALGDGRDNEEHCPDVLFERRARWTSASDLVAERQAPRYR